jgi:hypothetical protein
MWDFVLCTDETLEYKHDYVQWVFPTCEESEFNLQAGALSPSMVTALRSTPIIHTHAQASLQRMLNFYGFELRRGIFLFFFLHRSASKISSCQYFAKFGDEID